MPPGRMAELPLHNVSSHAYLIRVAVVFCAPQAPNTMKEIHVFKRFIIERDIKNIGTMTPPELTGAAEISNSALAKLAPKVQWEHSYVAKDKTFCVYLAEDESAIREHARLSGFPATTITEVPTMIDPTTARA
jgi:Protein of unknown function (DUF4242)